MSRVTTKIANVYLVGLPLAEEGFIWESVQRQPLPRWPFAILDLQAPLPPDVVDGRAVLLVGCDRTAGRNHLEVIQLLRLMMPNNPWFAIGPNSDAAADMAQSVGALNFLAQPFKLHQLPPALEQAAPHVGRVGPKPLTCSSVLRYAMFFGANSILRFRQADERTSGYVVLRNGQPVHARLADGTEGIAAFRAFAAWGVCKVSSVPLTGNLPPNIPEGFDAWLATTTETPTELMAPAIQMPSIPAPATPMPTIKRPAVVTATPRVLHPLGMAIADRIVHELEDTYWCYVVDTRTNRIVGMPPGEAPTEELEQEIVAITQQLLDWPEAMQTDAETERVLEVVLSSPDGWCAAYALEGTSLVVVLSAFGQLQSVIAQTIIAGVLAAPMAEPLVGAS